MIQMHFNRFHTTHLTGCCNLIRVRIIERLRKKLAAIAIYVMYDVQTVVSKNTPTLDKHMLLDLSGYASMGSLRTVCYEVIL